MDPDRHRCRSVSGEMRCALYLGHLGDHANRPLGHKPWGHTERIDVDEDVIMRQEVLAIKGDQLNIHLIVDVDPPQRRRYVMEVRRVPEGEIADA